MYLNRPQNFVISKTGFMLKRTLFYIGFTLFVCLPGFSQEMKSLSYAQFEKEMAAFEGEYLIVNYWATWCRPCVEEMPDFEKINAEFSGQGVSVWFVNVDFNSAVEKSVMPFILKKNLQSKLFHLIDTDPNAWIDKVNKEWGGNIPATAIYLKGNQIHFWARSTNYDELRSAIRK